MDVELVRGWNIDNDYSWGKTGHYKIAALACGIVSNKKLGKLLQANVDVISYGDTAMLADKMKEAKWGEFVPMADVPDIIWRMTRKDDEANHFADMDEKDPAVSQNKDLLTLCKEESNINIDVWNKFYEDFEAIDDTKTSDKRGALPFRVWQAYKLMIELLQQKDLTGFIFVGGTVSHYLGDACQPLHVSYLHHGHPDINTESPVHSTYETTMLDRFRTELFDSVNAVFDGRDMAYKVYTGGKAAAKAVISLMENVVSNILSPEEIIDVFNETESRGRVANMWAKLKDASVNCVAAGAENLALFWESAWAEGGGDQLFTNDELVAIAPDALIDRYMDIKQFPSYKLKDPRYKEVL